MRETAFAVLCCCLPCIAGCGLSGVPSPQTIVAATDMELSGSVHGGSQAIAGATVTLWTVGTTGYGSAASVVASTTSNSSGMYSLRGTTCSPTGELVYLTATGGNPGLSSGMANPQISLLTALGPCNAVMASQKIQITETTTVASVYALAQFMTPAGDIGSYRASTVGIANAFGTVGNLVDTSAGAALLHTPAGNGLAPQAELNTLANMLAACVNSAGGVAGDSSSCGHLFAAATPTGGSAPTNTLQAMLNIALNPGSKAAQLYMTASSSGPFQPTLSAAPPDWTMAVLFAGAGPATDDLAVDAGGNIWTANQGGNNDGNIAEMLPTGAVASGGPYLSGTDGWDAVAIDLSGNAWVTNYFTAQIDSVGASGHSVSGPFSLPETSQTQAVAVDGGNHVWVSNYGTNSISELSNQGMASTALSPSGGYTAASLNGPLDLAADALGNIWVADSGGSTLTKIASSGAMTGYAGNDLFAPSGLAVDGSNDLWVTNGSPNNAGVSLLVAFSATGAETGVYPPGPSLYLNGTFDAVDGANNIWVANLLNNSISEVSTNGTVLSPQAGFLSPNVRVAATGYSGAAMPAPLEVRIDESGNAWVPNENTVAIASGLSASLTELIGLAAPTVQPMALAVEQGQIGVRPGTPTGVTLAVTTTTLPAGTRNSPYQYQLLAKGGSANGYSWSVTSGGAALLGVGLTLSTSGLLSGTPTGSLSGTQIGVAVSDSANATAYGTVGLTVN